MAAGRVDRSGKVRITNTTHQRVIRLERFDLETDPGPGESPKLTQDQVSALFHETVRRSDSYFEAGAWPTVDSAGLAWRSARPGGKVWPYVAGR